MVEVLEIMDNIANSKLTLEKVVTINLVDPSRQKDITEMGGLSIKSHPPTHKITNPIKVVHKACDH